MAESDAERLLPILDALVALLRDHDEQKWLPWAEQCRREVLAASPDALDHIRGAYGGMGSFNDDAHLPDDGSAPSPDERLRRLADDLYVTATQLANRPR